MFNKFQLNTPTAVFLAKSRLSNSASVVLLKMMCHIDRLNMVVGTPAYIAKIAGITVRDFSIGIRALKSYDLVRKYTKKEYMLNPDVMFNGDDKQYFIVKHMWDKQTSRGLRE